MDAPHFGRNDLPPKGQTLNGPHPGYFNKKAEIKKKLMMMEAAMPAVLAWNMFQICQSDGISPAAAARKIFQMDISGNEEHEERMDESSLALLQKLEDLIHYQRKLRLEFEKAEELSKFRDRQLGRKVLELEARAEKNRRLFDEMIADLKHKTVDSSVDISLDSISSRDLIAFEEMQRLAENEIILKNKIDELEKKEKIYLNTLDQADQLWSALKSKSG
ncbi:UNVERIFIED_CONTAM: hypothetical protein PYX00_007564 [Menopon gallinae]|uniref:Uncharacterized protein n=1 Tax=Menopon gallinae TaxID=328185 RepID=A0AAW2HKH4_9NEOP